MDTLLQIDNVNIPEDAEVPFQCYTYNDADIYNEQPETVTHVLIPKEHDSLLFYPKIPIDIPLEQVKNINVQRILLTLEYEGSRKVQDADRLKLFCEERLRYSFADVDINNLNKYLLNKEDENIFNERKMKCYSCLNRLQEGDIVISHPSSEEINVHEHCLNNAMGLTNCEDNQDL
uniref:Uncharacterized protein n=1 Tax=viral metagenome TaxID=1070528 RepID=A0A6C0I6G0_9ZZZZ